MMNLLPTSNKMRTDLQDRIAEKEDRIEALRSQLDLPPLSGPAVAHHLDTVLRQHTICKQAYQGMSFIGNHCHAYMKA